MTKCDAGGGGGGDGGGTGRSGPFAVRYGEMHFVL